MGVAACGLMLLLGQIFLGISVLHNARAHGNLNPGMWCALTIIFGWIPAVIYLATRNSAQNRLMVCPQCQTAHPVGMVNCPQCGVHNVYSDPYHSPYTQKEAASSKHFMIAWIVLTAVGILGLIACFVAAICIVDFAIWNTHSYSHSYRYW